MVPVYKLHDSTIECLLCPHNCKLSEGQTGICRVRKNTGKEIKLLTYGVISGFSLDPVEKKPLYHFFPGYNILSIGSYGCNMRCDFCQNHNISQNIPESIFPETSPEKIVDEALSARKNAGIAFTYNEPVIWFEFMRDVATIAKNKGLFTAMVSNGYINSEPLIVILQFIDAFNIDLKAFNGNFYRKLTGSEIEPVKNSLKQIAHSGKHLEITTLIIPGLNDDPGEMSLQAEWIAGELGKSVPLHLSRYFPTFKRSDPATPEETLIRLYEIASENLDHVYIGNTRSEHGHNTICSNCGTTVTERSGYETRLTNIDSNGICTNCGTLVYRHFNFSSSTKN